ncbi:glycosyltransferase [Crateriforma conspicua]|uniref:Alpha-1,4-N-acetyl-D-galactosaminyltransferase n=1 Tax=Crateriforma conspicua TaxID=2527996 RepID=A0A5C5Y8D2_9PLAN|nr:glycosyltransferase [Crateriforma conspicua]TWT70525.1 alpha-1,4-N-acetyl-D-galactosaminyltransferase [Crateriforma conspicua]
MKITYLLSNPGIGGLEQRLAWIVPRLNCRGHDTSILNLCNAGRSNDYWRRSGVPVSHISRTSSTELLFLPRLLHHLRQERPDILHIYGLRANLLGRIAAKLTGVQAVVSGQVSTDSWRKWHHVIADRLTSPAVSLYMANSNAVRTAFIERERVSPDRIVTVCNGIDIKSYSSNRHLRAQIRREWGISPLETAFLMVANIRPAKNHFGLLDAVLELKKDRDNFKIFLVGEDYSQGRLEREIGSRNLNDVVRFLGHRPNAGSLWAGADIGLLSSVWEGSPFSLLEAMASGVAVISTRVGGVSELVLDGVTGLTVPPNDPQSFAHAMRSMLDSPSRRKEMAGNAQLRATKHYSLESMLDGMLAVYTAALRSRNGFTSSPISEGQSSSCKSPYGPRSL